MVLLVPHEPKRIYGLKDRNWPPRGKSGKAATTEDDWDNRAGLVLWLTDNGKGASVWQDSSGAGNHGTVYGAATPPAATPGALGYAFDGVDDYVACGTDNALNVGNAITISAWILPSTKASNGIVSKRAAWDSTNGYSLFITTTAIIFEMGDGTSSTQQILNHDTVYGVWYQLTATLAGGSILYYKNTARTGVKTGLSTIATNTQPLKISSGTGSFFNGTIGDVRIYNRALSPREITAYFQHTRGKYGV